MAARNALWKLDVLHRHWEDDPSPVWIIVILGLLLEGDLYQAAVLRQQNYAGLIDR